MKMSLKEAVWELLFPEHANCLGCASPLGTKKDWLCDECLTKLIPMRDSLRERCPRCGQFFDRKGLCKYCARWDKHVLTMIRSVYPYSGPAAALVKKMKYGGVYRLGEWMGKRMLEEIEAENIPVPDAFVPVPLHKNRMRERGFNQSEVLANALGTELEVPVMNALARTRDTKHQVGLSGESRRKNLDNAFSCIEDVRGMNLMLIDDVFTTGTTATRCAAVLSEAGASEINLLTFAATGR